MARIIVSIALLFLGLGCTFAQQGPVSAGGNATGAEGSVSFSIGQAVIGSTEGNSGSSNAGLQQPYWVEVITGWNDVDLSLAVFPNPAVDRITVRDAKARVGLVLEWLDAEGRILARRTSEGAETFMMVDAWSNGVYLLRISEGERVLKTFRISRL